MAKGNAPVALVDCNSFYASCEKLFRPDLRDRPVVVLSNNDSCIVAASEEAKKAGLKRGSPVFKLRHIIEASNAAVFSSNYALYADISRRVMGVLGELTPSLEVYSIDEAFLEVPLSLAGRTDALLSYGSEVREKVTRYTGIPVSVGIASTKTLAKAANRLAKKRPADSGRPESGPVYIIGESNRIPALKAVPVEDVWGVGRQYALFLRQRGIHTAYDLSVCDPWWVKKNMTLQGYRILMELNGEKQVNDEDPLAEKEAILSSKQFGRPVTRLDELLEAVSDYTTAAVEKLSRQSSLADTITVFITTDMYGEEDKKYSAARSFTFPCPVSYSPHLIKAARNLMKEIYRNGCSYRKTGVMLTGIVSADRHQKSLFDEANEKAGSRKIMDSVVSLNSKYGRNTVHSLASGFGSEEWRMRREMLSPCYTTRMKDFPVAFA